MELSQPEHLPAPSGLELWAGVECTVNRVGNDYLDQLERSGHARRLSDFELFASLGVKALRHGIVWEKTAPNALPSADWRWADASLARIHELGMVPIVGLVHHGSGPRSTSLLDPAFPELLASYAAAVASRYPWVDAYTPVNEPLTTARFSCLYGHWYPHAKDDVSFVRALINQCRGVILSMRAIRQVNPRARLVQTDDLGQTFSTPKLAYQADLENERRWASYDLICGTVTREHPLRQYFLNSGATDNQLDWFLTNACPPDVIGINHYLSSERYLDEDLQRYPEACHGGNGKHRYADVLAARVLSAGAAGPHALLNQAWNRYHLPIAITECHNGCTREEQLRWFVEVWRSANRARMDGADVRAVTAWSLLGAFDWNHLVTRNDGHYESGIFDIRSRAPRPTALVSVIRTLSEGREPEHPVLRIPGWWRRPDRFIYGFSRDLDGRSRNPPSEEMPASTRPILITGGRGTLARAFARICRERAIPYTVLTRQEMDITNSQSVRQALFHTRPWAIINAAGYVRVDDAELDRQRCYRENTEGAVLLANECAQRDIQLLTFSSDLVFGGISCRPYVESDTVSPLNWYGHSKAEAERRVFDSWASALIVRTSAFFGPWDEHNFVTIALRTLAANRTFRAAEDATVSPTYVPDLVNSCLDLLIDGESGVWHLSNAGEVSWADLAEIGAEIANVSSRTLKRCVFRDLNLRAARPSYSVLGSERALLLPTLQDALRRFAAQWRDKCELPEEARAA